MNHRTLTIGLAIIGIANGLALGGVAYNRMGEPESLLSLTERELRMTGDSRRSENSGVTGRIEWCVRDSVETFREIDEIGFELAGCYARTATWLNATRLEELGFDLSVAPDAPDAAGHYNHLLPRTAFFVLELDSAWHARIVDRARAFLATREQAATLAADSMPLRRAVASLRERFAWLERGSSRLFVIDAGTGVGSLRAKYPDRFRYAILPGTVRPTIRTSIVAGQSVRIVGQIGEIRSTRFNVPAEYQPLLQNAIRRYDFPYSVPPTTPTVTVSVAFGRRLEPWITSVK